MKRSVPQLGILPVALLITAGWLPLLSAWAQADQPRPHSVTLKWQPPVSAQAGNITGYNVYRGTKPGGPYAVIASRVPKPPYVDTGVESGKTYYYVVTSVDHSGRESKYSEETRATVP